MAERYDRLTALEACRPGSADLDLPEMAELKDAMQTDPILAQWFEAVQRWDETVRETVLSGDVPKGLEERILATLQSAEDLPTEAEQPTAAPAAGRGIRRRRLWMSLAAAAAVAALVTGATVWSLLSDPEPLAATTIHEEAVQWCDDLSAAGWRESAAPRTFPFPAEVIPSPDAWQRVSIPGPVEAAVAYRLPVPASSRSVQRMTLLVLKTEASGLGPFPPQNPYKTMDWLVAAWQVGENVYVLVIQGDDLGELQDVYQRYVNTNVRAA